MHSSDFEVNFTMIVAAAGSGKRMNASMKKQYLELSGVPIYMHSVLKGEESNIIDEIVIVAPEEDIPLIKAHCREYKIKKVAAIVPGGKERQDSVLQGLKTAKGRFVAVQDGARPFLQEEFFSKSLEVLQNEEEKILGTVIGVKAKDTIKIVDGDGIVLSTPPRENLYIVQTPQCFQRNYLLKIYEKATEEMVKGTDDASLVEYYGGRVKIVPGSYKNIKITTEEDLNIARSWKEDENTACTV